MRARAAARRQAVVLAWGTFVAINPQRLPKQRPRSSSRHKISIPVYRARLVKVMLSKVDFHGKPCSRGQTYPDKLRGCDARANTHPLTLSKMPL